MLSNINLFTTFCLEVSCLLQVSLCRMTELEEISKATAALLFFQTPFVSKLQALEVIQCISLL